MVDFTGIERVRQLVARKGTTAFIEELAGEIEADYRRWQEFDKSPRHAVHSPLGVIELMPISDSRLYSFKYVNDHPKNTAVSGDKHDYFSYGPYWWPDPARPDGLPYIRRDGEHNPSADNTDDTRLSQLGPAIEILGLAYWFSDDERYAQKAARLARVWFLDPATRMNPNFQHAQAIPGDTDGRGIGIIEARRLVDVNEGLALLAGSPAWTGADRAAFAGWLTEFYRWLTTSRNGRDEHAAENNHGSWYDAQVAHLALVLGRAADAKKVLSDGLTLRLARQANPMVPSPASSPAPNRSAIPSTTSRRCSPAPAWASTLASIGGRSPPPTPQPAGRARVPRAVRRSGEGLAPERPSPGRPPLAGPAGAQRGVL